MRRASVLTLIGLSGLVIMLGGCGGMATDTTIPDVGERRMFLALRVQDAAGNPIGGVRVFVDGRRDEFRTEWQFEPLGSGWPASWQGWQANWTSQQWSLYGPREPERLDIAVSKVGWTEDVTVVDIEDPSFDQYFIRDTMTLFPESSGQTAPPHEAEVVGG